MCTAANFNRRYFGRTLDLEYCYQEQVVITPEKYKFHYRYGLEPKNNYAMIGMATVADSVPLYYEATNEKGLSMAGLNFPGYAVYNEPLEGFQNVAACEFLPWILRQCKNLEEARIVLKNTNITKDGFNEKFGSATLHWIISDESGSLTVESVKEGLKVYDNPVEVLANSPEFPCHMINLSNYMNLTPEAPNNRFSENLELYPHSRGVGAIGLPGDVSSMSRFVRAAFANLNAAKEQDSVDNVTQFFHILGSVRQIKGLNRISDGKNMITHYISCCDTKKGIYYYTTYDNSQVNAVKMSEENIKGRNIIAYPLRKDQNIFYHNV